MDMVSFANLSFPPFPPQFSVGSLLTPNILSLKVVIHPTGSGVVYCNSLTLLAV